jgi:hypothetical protein
MSTHDQVHSHERHRRDRQIQELVHDPTGALSRGNRRCADLRRV